MNRTSVHEAADSAYMRSGQEEETDHSTRSEGMRDTRVEGKTSAANH